MAFQAFRQTIFGLVVQLRRGSVCYIGGSDMLPPPLTREEEIALMRRVNEQGDETARSTLIERNLRLVVYIARKFENTGIGIEDLISIGAIGLIKAVNSFTPEKNIKLATYASRCIENEILMHLRKTSNSRTEVSFDEPLNTDWDGKELLLSDVLGTDSDIVMRPIEQDVDRQLLHAAVSRPALRAGRGLLFTFPLPWLPQPPRAFSVQPTSGQGRVLGFYLRFSRRRGQCGNKMRPGEAS